MNKLAREWWDAADVAVAHDPLCEFHSEGFREDCDCDINDRCTRLLEATRALMAKGFMIRRRARISGCDNSTGIRRYSSREPDKIDWRLATSLLPDKAGNR